METMLRRIAVDYQLFGFVLESDPNVEARLKQRISSLTEDQFLDNVLVPLLERMKFERVRRVDSHGRNEFGSDVKPFRYVTPVGTLEYYALQAKAVRIHGMSAAQGNAGELISQVNQAFAVGFVDDLDNERKKIDKFIVATNQGITPDAERVIAESIVGDRKVVFWDIDRVATLVKKHDLVQFVLFTAIE